MIASRTNPTTPLTPDHARFASALRVAMEQRGWTRRHVAELTGVSPTMVGYWRCGRYLPSFDALDRLADIFPDVKIRQIVVDARTGRCPCGATFDREQTKRAYCSLTCQRRAHLKGGVKADPRQSAIDAMCRGCEPEGVCRDDACALRPFSPFIVIPFRRTA